MLEPLGIDAATEQVYLAMLREPDAGPEELARLLGRDPGSVRAALDELAQLSLIRSSWSDPASWRPVSPEVGLAALLAKGQAELAEQNRRMEEGRAAVAQLLAGQSEFRYAADDPDVERLSGVDEVRDRLTALSRECVKESFSMVPTRATTSAGLAASRPLNTALLERGVQIRTIYLDSIRYSPETIAHAHWLEDAGAEIRTAPTLPVRMHVIDRRRAIVPVQDAQSGSGAILLSAPGIVTALTALFEQTWRESSPLRARRVRDDEGLSEQERRLLRLWAQGATDEAAGRKLGISARTVRRLSGDLMARLGAASRFQAGAKAVARKWLDPDDLE